MSLVLVFFISNCGGLEWPPDSSSSSKLKTPKKYSYIMERGSIKKRVDVVKGTKIHIVKKGETLTRISVIHGVSIYKLAICNRIEPPFLIFPNQKIYTGCKLRTPMGLVINKKNNSLNNNLRLSRSKVRNKKIPRKGMAISGKEKITLTEAISVRRDFVWPLKGRVLSGFGKKAKGLRNDGINIAAPKGTPVKATGGGVVAYAGNELRGFGNLLLIKHKGGWVSAYAHNDSILVERGTEVEKGQKVATVGSTGNVSIPQLHFELRKKNRAINPISKLTKIN